MKLEELGLSPENLEKFRQILSKPYGLILVVGPTGSGKTTTLHSALQYIKSEEKKRKLCPKCKEPYQPSEDELREIKRLYGEKEFERDFSQELRKGIVLYRKKGCPACKNIGYKGRMGIHELLVNTPRMKPLILKGDVAGIKRAMVEEGMKSIFQDGIRKVIQGHTDLSQLLAVAMAE